MTSQQFNSLKPGDQVICKIESKQRQFVRGAVYVVDSLAYDLAIRVKGSSYILLYTEADLFRKKP